MQTPFELDALAKAHHYQKWIYESVAPHLGKRVLELGSGIGNLSQWLPDGELLVLSELESELISVLKGNSEVQKKKNIQIIQLDLEKGLSEQVQSFDVDTIVSFNVMEHIKEDVDSIRSQVSVLKNSKSKRPKRLVIFVPAHNFAYGALDRVFKHYRRYDAKMIREIFKNIDPSLVPQIRYFNALSFPGWIIQGKFFKKTVIKENQIKLIELMIPFWKPFDYLLTKILRYPLGQSLICVVEIQ